MAYDWLDYANQGAIRNDPLHPKLVEALGSFLPQMGVTMQVFSGGQEAYGPSRTGSHRHDNGNAGDVIFFKDGRQLDWANPEDRPIFQEIVQRGKKAGITGFGAGPGYMQQGSMHLGFGAPAVWGDGGKGENAPGWLKAAFNGGVNVQPADDPAYSAGPGRGSVAGYRTPGAYSGGQYVPGVEKTFYDARSPLLPGNDGNGVGASLGGFAGGPGEVARRNIENFKVVPATASGDMRPTNFQRNAARQAMEGDQSQRARLLQAAGLDPTGKTRTAPRSADPGVLSKLMEGLKLPTAEDTQKKQNPFGIFGNLFNFLS